MSKSLVTAAIIFALSVTLAHGESRFQRGGSRNFAASATAMQPQGGQRGHGQQMVGAQAQSTSGNGVLAQQRQQTQQLQNAQMHVNNHVNNHDKITQTTNTNTNTNSSVVRGNNNTVNTASSQMIGNTFQGTRNLSGTGTSRFSRGDRGGTASQNPMTGQRMTADSQQNMMQPQIRNEIGQTGNISSTIRSGNMNTANAASVSMSGMGQQREMMQPSTMARSSMQEQRVSPGGMRNTALGQNSAGEGQGGLMRASIRNEVRQTGAISSTIGGGDNNIANAASLSMTGTRNMHEVRNRINGTGDISSRIIGGSDNRANAASISMGETSVGGRVVNDVSNTGAISSMIKNGSNNQANAASVSIN